MHNLCNIFNNMERNIFSLGGQSQLQAPCSNICHPVAYNAIVIFFFPNVIPSVFVWYIRKLVWCRVNMLEYFDVASFGLNLELTPIRSENGKMLTLY